MPTLQVQSPVESRTVIARALRRAAATTRRRAPELRLQRLFRDRFVGVVRAGHPLSRGAVTAQRFFVATVPRYLVEHMKGALDVDVFTLPFELRPVVVAQAWHPRFDKDPAHRWLRETMKATCRPLATMPIN